MVVLALPVGLLAGVLTARAARCLPWQHGLALGCVTALALAASTLVAKEGQVPAWYQLSLPVVASLAALAGAVLAGPGRASPSPTVPAKEQAPGP
jgi:hypothetical protein